MLHIKKWVWRESACQYGIVGPTVTLIRARKGVARIDNRKGSRRERGQAAVGGKELKKKGK